MSSDSIENSLSQSKSRDSSTEEEVIGKYIEKYERYMNCMCDNRESVFSASWDRDRLLKGDRYCANGFNSDKSLCCKCKGNLILLDILTTNKKWKKSHIW